MSELSPIEALAVDYVLGQLNRAERLAVTARLQREPELQAAVAAWERRLAPLDELTPAVEPPAHVFPAIEARIAASRKAPLLGGQVIDLGARLKRWRAVAGLTGALAASLLMVLVVRELDRPPVPGNFVAVLQKDAASPAFILTVDLARKSYTVRSVAAELQTEKSYELWLISDKFPSPRSLGVVGQGTFDEKKALSPYDPAVVTGATYAVTLEAKGGSPTGQPQGPVVYAGKLVQATP